MKLVKAIWQVSLCPPLSCSCADHCQPSQASSLSGVDCIQAIKEWGFPYGISYWKLTCIVHYKLILMFLTLLFFSVNHRH